MEDVLLTIEFALESSEVNGRYEQKSQVPVYRQFDTELSIIGQQLVSFLKQVGYGHMDKDYIYVESLTADEYEAVEEFVEKYRAEHE